MMNYSAATDSILLMNDDSDLSHFKFSDDESSEDEPSQSDSAYDSDDDAPIKLTGVWGPAGRQPASNAFLGRQGPSSACSPTDVESPLDYFLLIFDHEVFGKVVIETNSYADQDLRANTPVSASTSKMLPWKEVDEDDVRKFLGHIMLMDFTERHGSLQLYWTTDPYLTIPIFHQVTLLAVVRFCDFIRFYLNI